MRKFLLKISAFLVYALLIKVVFPVAVDPFSVFHPENPNYTVGWPNTNYIKMVYILNHPERFDSFIFGSSRVEAINPEKMPGHAYNMTYAAALPVENMMNIRTFFRNNIKPSRIYVGVDSLSYTWPPEDHIQDPGRCPYEYLQENPDYFYSMYLNPVNTFRSLWTKLIEHLNEHVPEADIEAFYRTGGAFIMKYDRKTKYVWGDDKDTEVTIGHEINIEPTLDSIKEIVRLCRENGTELILFTNPMHRVTYLASVRNKEYFRFLEGLAQITPFWNFSSLNDITTDNNAYTDPSHYRAEVGDILINVMCYGKSYPELNKQGFGVKITRENAKDFITMLRKQAEDYETAHQ